MPPRSSLPAGKATHITTATTTAVKVSGGVLLRIINLAVVAAIVTINETVNGATAAIAVLPASLPVGTYELGITCRGKIEIVTAGASNLIVVSD